MFDFKQPESSSTFMNSSHHPYTSSIASSASSSSASVFSADSVSSQTSVSSTSTSSIHIVWGTEDRKSSSPVDEDTPQYAAPLRKVEARKEIFEDNSLAASNIDTTVVPDLRQHPRRTKPLASQDQNYGTSATDCPRPPPTLVRQCDRKVNFVDNLVGKLINSSVWSEGCTKSNIVKTLLRKSLRPSGRSPWSLVVVIVLLVAKLSCRFAPSYKRRYEDHARATRLCRLHYIT